MQTETFLWPKVSYAFGILWRSWKATWRLFSHHPGFSPRREISTEWCSRQIWGGWDISTRLEWRDKLRRLYDSSSRFMLFPPWTPPNPVQDLNSKSTAYHSAQPCAVLMLWTAFYRNMQETCMNLASTKMYKANLFSLLSFRVGWVGSAGQPFFWANLSPFDVVLKIWFKPRHSPLCGITMAEPEEEGKEERKPETQSPSDLLSDFTSLSGSKCSLFSSSLNGDKGCFCMFPYHSIPFHRPGPAHASVDIQRNTFRERALPHQDFPMVWILDVVYLPLSSIFCSSNIDHSFSAPSLWFLFPVHSKHYFFRSEQARIGSCRRGIQPIFVSKHSWISWLYGSGEASWP